MDDTSSSPTYRIVIRVVVPPDRSALLIPDLKRHLEDAGFPVLGMTTDLEDDSAPSDPSVLR